MPAALYMPWTRPISASAKSAGTSACATAAQRIKDGYNHALAEGCKTRDLGAWAAEEYRIGGDAPDAVLLERLRAEEADEERLANGDPVHRDR